MSDKTSRRGLRALSLTCLLAAALATTASPPPSSPAGSPSAPPGAQDPASQEAKTMTEPGGWAEVDRLVAEDKYEAASRLADELKEQARAAGDETAWARALIKLVQLRTGLHGYETAVRFLAEEPWPETPRLRALVGIFYAEALTNYLDAYSWEIRQREAVEAAGPVDLEAWTGEQIYGEARKVFHDLWSGRDAWGTEPLGDGAEFIRQNDFPPRIRGTLRDTASYLFADLLANRSFWSPAQSNSVYRLDLASLLAGPDPRAAFADPEAHPLVQAAAVLTDLEAWHRAENRPEAAFEARRDLLRRLRESLTRAEDRRRLRTDLEQHLDALGRRFPWWATGMATRAEMVRDEDSPQALVRAREIALEAARVHPDSWGGRQCRALADSIEAPDYQLTAMTADGRGRRSILVRHKNLETLYFRAYPLDLEREVEAAQDWSLLPDVRRVEEIVSAAEPEISWTEELPPTPDYRHHQTYVTPPLVRPGLYIVVASGRQDFGDSLNHKGAVRFLLTDLVLLTRPAGSPGVLEVTARSGASGEPLANTEIALYRYDWRQRHTRLSTLRTDAHGSVRMTLPEYPRERYFLLARQGPQQALDELNRWWVEPEAPGEHTAALLYTDRSVYRPLQKVLWKVAAYQGGGEASRFETLPRRELTVELVDPNDQVVVSETVTTNDLGTASGGFDIPPGRLLGRWTLRTSLGGANVLRVEEYKRPTFEVRVKDPEEALRLNRPATLSGEARYYFGLPVSAGEATWEVTREPLFPWWWWWYHPPGGSTAGEILAAGSSEIAPDGTFGVTFRPEADEREAAAGVTYRFRLRVDVTDEGGETRSASRVFRLGAVAVEAALTPARAFWTSETAGEIDVRRTDLDGVGRPGAGSWRLLELTTPEKTLLPADQPVTEPPAADRDEPQEEPYRTAGDRLRPRWESGLSTEAVLASWTDGRELGSGSLDHDGEGRAKITLPALPPGAYRLRYTTEDRFGATFETFRDLLVVAAPGPEGKANDPARPLPLPLLLVPEEPRVEVGGTLRLLIHSGFDEQAMVLEMFRGGRRFARRILTSTGGPRIVEVPVGLEHRGGFGLRLTALRDHQLLARSENVFVPWDDRRLDIRFATFRDRLTPGDRETWKIEVRGAEGEALAAQSAEVLAYMYDRSLDLFAAHTPPDVLGLYPTRFGVPQLGVTLGALSEIWRRGSGFRSAVFPTALQPDRLNVASGYGIGGLGEVVFGIPEAAGPVRMEMARSAAPVPAARVAPAPPPAPAAPAETDALGAGEAELVGGGAGEAPPEPVTPRTDFAETAFWEPHLRLSEDGSAAFEFTVPDSVTEWNVWVHALTRDLRGGSRVEKARTVKDLLVRPYLPRFLREGDRAILRVAVNNAGEVPLTGTLDFEILDPETEESLLATFGLTDAQAHGVPFSVEPGGGITLAFPVVTPPRVGPVAFRVTARAGDLSDGELRPLPVLPGRFHLAQSRFATLHDRDRRTLTFPDLARSDDPGRIDEQLVVTLDAQLFYSVLNALPYLVSFPYECTEQTLNRFLSTGIVTSVFEHYPAVARMAKEMASRETRYETWDQTDPNRKMALEETPWLIQARGGAEAAADLIPILDPRIAGAQRRSALAKLEKSQTSLGGFPWWPGGPPSPYMTLYILRGFARALEFGVEVPRAPVVRAWSYLHRHWLDEWARRLVEDECCWEWITFLNYVLSSYPEGDAEAWTGGVFSADDRKRMLDFSYRHWRQHSPLLKSYLALTLERAGRSDDARLVFDSIMDSAKTDPDLGTYWAPEDRSWLWYNDTIESHAFALRALTELDPDDERRHGLVQWLMLDKKLNHWKSTRATAEVIYSLVHYLEREGALGVREEATVTAGPVRRDFVFEPDAYTGKKAQMVVPGDQVVPAMAEVVVEKDTPGLLFASATWHFSTEKLPEEASGDFFSVTRRYFLRVSTPKGWVLRPLDEGASLSPGDQVEVQLSLRAKHQAEYVHLRDPRGAGFEPETLASGYKWDLGIGWYEEVRDSGTNFFFERLPVGEYTFKYRLRAAHGGTFKVSPAVVQPMYAPEFVAYSAGARIEIGE